MKNTVPPVSVIEPGLSLQRLKYPGLSTGLKDTRNAVLHNTQLCTWLGWRGYNRTVAAWQDGLLVRSELVTAMVMQKEWLPCSLLVRTSVSGQSATSIFRVGYKRHHIPEDSNLQNTQYSNGLRDMVHLCWDMVRRAKRSSGCRPIFLLCYALPCGYQFTVCPEI